MKIINGVLIGINASDIKNWHVTIPDTVAPIGDWAFAEQPANLRHHTV